MLDNLNFACAEANLINDSNDLIVIGYVLIYFSYKSFYLIFVHYFVTSSAASSSNTTLEYYSLAYIIYFFKKFYVNKSL